MDYAADAPRTTPPAASMLKRAIDAVGLVTPLLDLGIRLYVANVFFKAGLTKISNWDSTIALFENEYNVPVLSPALAAYLGTGAELFLPVLLALGLLARPAALALFVFNIVAVISYPGISPAGVSDHFHWGLLMAVTMFHGPGTLCIDHLIARRLFR